MLSKIKESVEKKRAFLDMMDNRSANIKWLFVNRDELIENYPNRWVAILNEAVQFVDVDAFTVFKTMALRDSGAEVVYFYCSTHEPPVILMSPMEDMENVDE